MADEVSQLPLSCVCHLIMLTSCFVGFGAAICGVNPQVSTIDFMATQIANSALCCVHVIVLTESKTLLSTSVPVCDKPATSRLVLHLGCT